MSDEASRRAERLKKALRDNLKRRKAAPDESSPGAMTRRADRLEPKLARPQERESGKPGAD